MSGSVKRAATVDIYARIPSSKSIFLFLGNNGKTASFYTKQDDVPRMTCSIFQKRFLPERYKSLPLLVAKILVGTKTDYFDAERSEKLANSSGTFSRTVY